MQARIRWLVGELRAGPSHEQYGDPYEVGVVIVPHGPDEVEIRLLDRPTTRDHWRAIKQALREAGFRRWWFERRKDQTARRQGNL